MQSLCRQRWLQRRQAAPARAPGALVAVQGVAVAVGQPEAVAGQLLRGGSERGSTGWHHHERRSGAKRGCITTADPTRTLPCMRASIKHSAAAARKDAAEEEVPPSVRLQSQRTAPARSCRCGRLRTTWTGEGRAGLLTGRAGAATRANARTGPLHTRCMARAPRMHAAALLRPHGSPIGWYSHAPGASAAAGLGNGRRGPLQVACGGLGFGASCEQGEHPGPCCCLTNNGHAAWRVQETSAAESTEPVVVVPCQRGRGSS